MTHTPTCGYCQQPATVVLEARSQGSETVLRSTLACPTHRNKAHTWVARAGPVHEQHLDGPDQELATLF